MKPIEIKNVSDTEASIYIYGDIASYDMWGDEFTPDILKAQLETFKGKTLNLYINSNGGDVFAGTSIYNMLKRHDGKVKAYVDGLAASIASLILMSAEEIYIPANGYVMIHRPTCRTNGNSDDLMRMAELLDDIENDLIESYQTHSDTEYQTLKDLVNKETWLNGKEFTKVFNKNTFLIDALDAVACVSDIDYKNKPKSIVINKEEKEQTEDIEAMKKEIAIALAINE